MLVDMINFKQTTLSSNKETIVVGGGVRWGDVYQALKGSGVSINGAQRGQTLGGGIGWLTNLARVCAALVVAADIAPANSSIVRADNETNSDLLWALKGGGLTYGVVTSFTFKTFALVKVWFESRQYSSDKTSGCLMR